MAILVTRFGRDAGEVKQYIRARSMDAEQNWRLIDGRPVGEVNLAAHRPRVETAATGANRPGGTLADVAATCWLIGGDASRQSCAARFARLRGIGPRDCDDVESMPGQIRKDDDRN